MRRVVILLLLAAILLIAGTVYILGDRNPEADCEAEPSLLCIPVKD